jgi:hypothetical protein
VSCNTCLASYSFTSRQSRFRIACMTFITPSSMDRSSDTKLAVGLDLARIFDIANGPDNEEALWGEATLQLVTDLLVDHKLLRDIIASCT